MATVMGVGVGFIVLAVIWIVCIALFIALSRAQGAMAWAGVGLLFVAALLTVILWFIPRGESSTGDDHVIYDKYYGRRTGIVTVCGIFLAFGGVMYVLLHCFELQRAKSLTKLRTN